MLKTKRNRYECELDSLTLSDVLKTLACHVGTLSARSPSVGIKGCGISASDGTSVMVSVKIELSRHGQEWDQITLNGECCGNRSGGTARLAELYAPVIAAQARHDAARVANAA